MQTWEKIFENIRTQFVSGFDSRLDRMEEAIESLATPALQGDALVTLYLDFHGLSGSATTYGFERVCSESARAEAICRALLDNQCPPVSSEIEELRTIVQKLRIGSPSPAPHARPS